MMIERDGPVRFSTHIPAPTRMAITAMAIGILGFAPARAGIATGPKVGTRIPAIEALDQDGRMRTFDDLRGPEGLLLLFYRTADW